MAPLIVNSVFLGKKIKIIFLVKKKSLLVASLDIASAKWAWAEKKKINQ